ncbi:MAG: amidohydrolase family protein, partial [Steroidobacteraceae bacterium]
QSITLRCGRIIDMVSGRIAGPAAILVRGSRIEKISSAEPPAGVDVIDLTAMTCLPGLIDLHAHIGIDPDRLHDMERSSAEHALDALRHAQIMLRAGFTTLRDPGEFDRYYATVAVRNAIASGKFVGPRLFVAPHLLGPTGGHGDFNALAPDLQIEAPTRTADGVDEIRRAVREEIKRGADWIKLALTGGVMSAGDNPAYTAYTDEELRAAVDETHRLGRKITVHAIGAPGIKAAVMAGVDCVEHGSLIDDETIKLMKQRGTCLVPTLYVLKYIIEQGPRLGYSEESLAKGRALDKERQEHLHRALVGGVKIGFGSDTIFPHHLAPREFAELVNLGLTPQEALRTATVNAADVLGISAEVGTLEPGKLADIVAVAANPFENIRTLEDVRFVMSRGRVIRLLEAESLSTP